MLLCADAGEIHLRVCVPTSCADLYMRGGCSLLPAAGTALPPASVRTATSGVGAETWALWKALPFQSLVPCVPGDVPMARCCPRSHRDPGFPPHGLCFPQLPVPQHPAAATASAWRPSTTTLASATPASAGSSVSKVSPGLLCPPPRQQLGAGWLWSPACGSPFPRAGGGGGDGGWVSEPPGSNPRFTLYTAPCPEGGRGEASGSEAQLSHWTLRMSSVLAP